MQIHPHGSETLSPRKPARPAPPELELVPSESFEQASVVQALPEKPAFASLPVEPPIQIQASADISKESLEKLRRTAERAMAHFEKHYGPVSAPLKFAVGGATTALRTGYSFDLRTIAMPDGSDLRNCGLDSEDIINHEIFHALMHQAYPDTCTPERMESPETERLHEALADYFAHRLQPDESFGENYYHLAPQVRAYRTSLQVSLTAGAHGQGNAIVKHLLEQDVTDTQVRSFLEGGQFNLESLGQTSEGLAESLRRDAAKAVDEAVSHYPHSPRDRYWLQPEQPLEVAFLPNEDVRQAHPDFRVVWLDKKGMPSRLYTFEETSPHKFRISGAPEAETEKMIARFYDGDRVIGFRPFYFGVRKT